MGGPTFAFKCLGTLPISSFTRRGRRQSDFRVGPDPLVSDPGLRLNTACPVWAGLGILAEG